MNIYDKDTIIAPATIPGTGAISLIRISGPRALETADSILTFKKGKACDSPGNTIKFATVFDGGQMIDEVICNIYRAPHSYTGEDSVEIMCHASSYIVSSILQLAIASGCRMAQPGEFTQRSFLAGKMDLAQAEAVADVISSTTKASHRLAISQLKGAFSSSLASLREELLKMSSLLELELDFSEEDVEFADRKKLLDLVERIRSKVDSLATSFKLGNAIKNGIPVAIVGATNSGKSTLLNAILGEQRAIVSDIAGTTRDTIEECFTIDGVLYRFVDTAGIRSTDGEIERIGIQRSFESLQKSNAVIFLLDSLVLGNVLGGLTDESDAILSTEEYLSQILEKVDFSSQKVIFAFNKMDVCGDLADNIFTRISDTIVSFIEKLANDAACRVGSKGCRIPPSFVSISAKTGSGVDALLSEISSFEKGRKGAGNTLSSLDAESDVIVTNIRHYEALVEMSGYLKNVRSGLESGKPTDLVAEDLRAVISSLGSITGQITSTDVLNNIFGKFCIGK